MHIPEFSDISRHIPVRHNQTCSGTFRALCNPDILRTLANSQPEAYSEHCYIQNPSIFTILNYFAKIVNILHEINIMKFLIQV